MPLGRREPVADVAYAAAHLEQVEAAEHLFEGQLERGFGVEVVGVESRDGAAWGDT